MIEVELTEEELFFLKTAATKYKKGGRREFCGSGLAGKLYEKLIEEIGSEGEKGLRAEWQATKEDVADDNCCPECNKPRN